jgi:HMG (high mobility group) box
MDASDDRVEDVEMAAAAFESVADGERNPDASTDPADKDMDARAQPAADADAEMTPCEQLEFEGIEVAATPPESSKGVTAYFVFANVHRERVKAALQADLPDSTKVTIGMVGKKIGDVWKQCTDAVKQAYSNKAKKVWS